MDQATLQFRRFAEQGDADALGLVFRLVAPRLLAIARRRCDNRSDAEDVVQATFLVAIRKAACFEQDKLLAPWLTGILDGEIRNVARRSRRRGAEREDEVACPRANPALVAEQRDFAAELWARLEELPAAQREALRLQIDGGWGAVQIAERVGVAAGTVRMRLHRGIQALKKLLPASVAAWLCGSFGPRHRVLREGGTGGGAGSGGSGALLAKAGAGQVGKWLVVAVVIVGVGVVGAGLVLHGSVGVGSASTDPIDGRALALGAVADLAPSSDSDLDELRRWAVKVPLDELFAKAPVFLSTRVSTYKNDEVLWRGVDRMTKEIIENPARRVEPAMIGCIINQIEGIARPDQPSLRERIPQLRRRREQERRRQ